MIIRSEFISEFRLYTQPRLRIIVSGRSDLLRGRFKRRGLTVGTHYEKCDRTIYLGGSHIEHTHTRSPRWLHSSSEVLDVLFQLSLNYLCSPQSRNFERLESFSDKVSQVDVIFHVKYRDTLTKNHPFKTFSLINLCMKYKKKFYHLGMPPTLEI